MSDSDSDELSGLVRWEGEAASRIGLEKVSIMLVSEAIRVYKIISPHVPSEVFLEWVEVLYNRSTAQELN